MLQHVDFLYFLLLQLSCHFCLRWYLKKFCLTLWIASPFLQSSIFMVNTILQNTLQPRVCTNSDSGSHHWWSGPEQKLQKRLWYSVSRLQTSFTFFFRSFFFLKYFYFNMLNINQQTKFQEFSNILFYVEFLLGMHIWIINNSRRRAKIRNFNVSQLKTLICKTNNENKY